MKLILKPFKMQLPFIAKVMGDRQFKIVPVLVGSLNSQRQQVFKFEKKQF